MQHRRGHEGAKITRVLFGTGGRQGRQDAYRMIDEAPAGTHFYRVTISPDPKGENGNQDFDLRDITARTIHALEEMIHRAGQYVAAVHADHAPHRHVYLLASVPTRLNKPDLDHLRATATQACLEQRQERDREERHAREREEEPWEL